MCFHFFSVHAPPPALGNSASYAGLNEWEEAANDAAQCIKVNKNFVKGELSGCIHTFYVYHFVHDPLVSNPNEELLLLLLL